MRKKLFAAIAGTVLLTPAATLALTQPVTARATFDGIITGSLVGTDLNGDSHLSLIEIAEIAFTGNLGSPGGPSSFPIDQGDLISVFVEIGAALTDFGDFQVGVETASCIVGFECAPEDAFFTTETFSLQPIQMNWSLFFEPATAVPLPAAAGLSLGWIGALGLVAARRRRAPHATAKP